jgi:hypothetical protein
VRWVNPAGGSWDVAANWLDDAGVHRLPGPGDRVVIDVPNDVVTIRHSTGIASIVDLICEENLVLEGGSGLVLSAASTVAGNLSINDGEVRGAGSLTALGQFVWTEGTLRGTGAFTSGTITIEGSRQKILDGRIVSNVGQALVQAGVRGRNRGGFDNLAGATFELRTDADVYLADVTFYNRGGAILRKTGSTNSQVYGYVSNDGLVEVEAGSFAFVSQASFGMGRSTSSGQFVATAANAGRLDLGYMNLTSSSSITAKRVNLGYMRLEGDYNVTEFTGTGQGDVVFAGTITNLGEWLAVGDVTTWTARDNIYLANALIVNEASGVIEVTGPNLLRRGDSPVRFQSRPDADVYRQEAGRRRPWHPGRPGRQRQF